MRCPGELAGKADREIADVDHFLHFAEPFGRDFSRFNRDEASEFRLQRPQLFAKEANEFTALGCRNKAPFAEGRIGLFDGLGCIGRRMNGNIGNLLAGDRAVGGHCSTGIGGFGHAKLCEECFYILSNRHFAFPLHIFCLTVR
jgi:hypothetical protein